MLGSWRPIPEYRGYEASADGRVRNAETGRVLSGSRRHDGYVQVSVTVGNKKVTRYVHRLVAAAFHGSPADGHCVNHKNLCRWDNRSENLEWCTYKQNTQHAIASGAIQQSGENSQVTDLTDAQVLRMRDDYASGWGDQSAIAKKYNTTEAVVFGIMSGRTWASVTGGDPVTPPVEWKRQYDYEHMATLRKQGLSYRAIAKRVGCTYPTARRGCLIVLGDDACVAA